MKLLPRAVPEPEWGGSIIYTDDYSKDPTRLKQKKKVAILPKIMKGMIKRRENAKGETIQIINPASDCMDFFPFHAEEDELFSDTRWNLDFDEDAITALFTPEDNQGLRKFNVNKEVEEDEAGTVASTPHEDYFSENGECLTGNECLQDIKRLEMSTLKRDLFCVNDADESVESEETVNIIRKLFNDDESVRIELQSDPLILYKTPQKQETVPSPKEDTEPSHKQDSSLPKKEQTGPDLEIQCKSTVTDARMKESKQLGVVDLWDAAKDVIEAFKLYGEEGSTKKEICQVIHADGLTETSPKYNEIGVVVKLPLKSGGSVLSFPLMSTSTILNSETGVELQYKTPQKGLKQPQTTIFLPANEYERCEVHISSPSTAFGMNVSLNDSDVFESIDDIDSSQESKKHDTSLDSPDIVMHAHALEMRCFDIESLDPFFPAFYSPVLEAADFGNMMVKDTHEAFSPFAKTCAHRSKVIDETKEEIKSQGSKEIANFGEMPKAARDNEDILPITKSVVNHSKGGDGFEANDSFSFVHPNFGTNMSCNEDDEDSVVMAWLTSFERDTRTPVKDNTVKNQSKSEAITIDANDTLEDSFPSPLWDQTHSTVESKNAGMHARKIDYHTPREAHQPQKNMKDLSFMLSDANTLLSSLQDLSLSDTNSKDLNGEDATKENLQEVLRSMKDECTDRLEYNVNKISLWKSSNSLQTVAKQNIPSLTGKNTLQTSPHCVEDFPLDEILEVDGLDKASLKPLTLGGCFVTGDTHRGMAKISATNTNEKTEYEKAPFSISQRIALLQKNFSNLEV